MKKKRLYFSFLLFASLSLQAQDTNIRFVNVGSMNVQGTMYVCHDMQTKNVGYDPAREVRVVHNGLTALTGSFYHDARKNVFVTVNEDWSDRKRPKGAGISTGTFKFTGEQTGGRRYISATDTASFDRVTDYIAFPKLEIATGDRVYVPSTMGLDTRVIIRKIGHEGQLYLASNVAGNAVYDASLRVTGDNGDYTVPEGAVVVEKQVREFRETSGGGAATMLMPFAAPFKNLRSGYFAGNWVRRPQFDSGRNSFLYPYANYDGNGDGVIDRNQYVVDATEELAVTEAYLLRLQKAGATEDAEYSTLLLTTGEAHDKDKFILDGSTYSSLGADRRKILFAGEPVLHREVKTGITTTQNWVAGNSYTSALSGEAIARYLMEDAKAVFNTNLHVYPHGASTYQTYPMWDGNVVPAGIPDIQAMSVFMIVADRNNEVEETIAIGPEYQVHAGGISATTQPSGRSLRSVNGSRLVFVVTPEDNPFVYDRTVVRLHGNAREGADNYDTGKMLNPANRLFELYGDNLSGSPLQENALPPDAGKALLSINPAAETMDCVLSAEGVANFDSETVMLYDKLNKQWHDLRADNSYRFRLSPGDAAGRFEVHLRTATNIDTPEAQQWTVSCRDNKLYLEGLDDSLLNAGIRLYHATGGLALSETVRETPRQAISTGTLPAGIYLLSIGTRTVKVSIR